MIWRKQINSVSVYFLISLFGSVEANMSDLFNEYSKIDSEVEEKVDSEVKPKVVVLKENNFGYIERELSGLGIRSGDGSKKTYKASYDEIWISVINIVNSTKLNIAKGNKETGKIFARQGATSWSYGEDVGIFIKPIDLDRTSVEIVSKRVMSGNFLATNWEDEILELLSEQHNEH